MRFITALGRLSLSTTPRIITRISPLALSTPTAARSLSTSSTLYAATASSKLSSSAGSGQGTRADKDKARKEREKAKLTKERERERARKEKEREKARKLKEKEKAIKLKEKAKLTKALKPIKAKTSRTRSQLHPPKAPVNAWGVYLAQYVQERKEALPTGEKLPSVTQLAGEAAPLYKGLSPEEKAPLVEESQRQRAEYPAILEAWKQSLSPEMIKEENALRSRRRKAGLSTKKGIKLAGEPKKPLTGYMRYAAEVRADPYGGILRGETDIIEQSKRIAEGWRGLSAEEQKVYHDQYQVAKGEYLTVKAEWDAEQAKRVSA